MTGGTRVALGAVVGSVLVAVAGCGSGSGSIGASTPATIATVTPTVTSTARPSPSQSTSDAGPSACADGSIRVSVGEQSAGLGNNLTVLLFDNVTGQACYLRGFPGVTPYVHREAGTPARRRTSGYFGNAHVTSVLIKPGGVASAMVDGSDNPVGGKRSCPTYTSLKVTPPNLHTTATLNVKIPACARLSVQPVAHGKHGSPQR